MEKSRGTKNQLEQLRKLKKENFSHPQQPFLFSFRKTKQTIMSFISKIETILSVIQIGANRGQGKKNISKNSTFTNEETY